MIIRNVEKQTEDYKSITLNALRVKAVLVNPNADPSNADIDWEAVQVKVILRRGQETFVVMQDDLKKLGLASQVDRFNQFVFSQSTQSELLGGGSAMLAFKIPFGGAICLKGDDYLHVEINNLKGLFTPAIAATSYIEVTPNKCVAYETCIPSIKTMVIQAGESSRRYDLGDNVTKAVFLNYDKEDFKTPVIANLTINSDRFNEDFTFQDLILDKTDRYHIQAADPAKLDVADRIQKDQCFVVLDGQEYDQVSLNVKFNSANVAASQNYIVYWDFYTSPEILQKAAEKSVKHSNEAADKIQNQKPKA